MLLIVAGSDLTWLTRCARTLARSTQCTLCVSVPAMDAAVGLDVPGSGIQARLSIFPQVLGGETVSSASLSCLLL